jgi:GTPase SAR1 family protein
MQKQIDIEAIALQKEDLKARETVVWAMFGKRLSKNPLKRKIHYLCSRIFPVKRFVNRSEREHKNRQNEETDFFETGALYVSFRCLRKRNI